MRRLAEVGTLRELIAAVTDATAQKVITPPIIYLVASVREIIYCCVFPVFSAEKRRCPDAIKFSE